MQQLGANTQPDCSATAGSVTIPAGYEFPTLPHLSQARAEGVAWLTGFDFGRRGEDLAALTALVAS